MELRQLRYFMAVADELHFGRAAERLHMSQPPLSVQVARLEQELGVALFQRTTRRVTLTPAGVHLKERASELDDLMGRIHSDMQEFADGVNGHLTVGFVSSANYTVLPGVVRLFRAHRPQVTVRMVPLTSGEQLEGLRDGSLDVAIIRDEVPRDIPDEPPIRAEVVFEERLVACLPVAHPLAERNEVTAAEIALVPMVSYPASLMPGYVQRVADVFADSDAVPTVAEEVVHQETALSFVAAGVGTSILPESVRQMAPPSVAVVPLAGSPTTRLLAARSTRSGNGAILDAFISCLHDAAAEMGNGASAVSAARK
ncbi:MAG: LysR family transcriptional regulator [Mycetocola sp.]